MGGGVLGVYRIKNEARWIKESLEMTRQIAKEVLVLDDHSEDNTIPICRSVPGVTVIESPYQGLDEVRDKNYLFMLAVSRKPDWIIWMDGDEVLAKNAIREARRLIGSGVGGIHHFRIVYLWDRPNQERVDGIYGRFMAARMFSMFDQNPAVMEFKASGHGGNFHCGQVPRGHKGPQYNTSGEIKHYGYIDESDRQRKYKWYNQKDPNNQIEGEYRHMIGLPDLHCPGPVILRPWTDWCEKCGGAGRIQVAASGTAFMPCSCQST